MQRASHHRIVGNYLSVHHCALQMRATALYPTQACLSTKDDDPLALKLGSCRKLRTVRSKAPQNVPRSFCHLQRSCEILAHVRMLLLRELYLASLNTAFTPPSDVGPKRRATAGVQRVALAAAIEGQSAL